MSLDYLRGEAFHWANQLRLAEAAAQEAANAYVQAREVVKVGDEVETIRTRRRFAITGVFVKHLDRLIRGEEPEATFSAARVLKSGLLGERTNSLWLGSGCKDARVVGRYQEPKS